MGARLQDALPNVGDNRGLPKQPDVAPFIVNGQLLCLLVFIVYTSHPGIVLKSRKIS